MMYSFGSGKKGAVICVKTIFVKE